jgi:predicted N-formylglutamate amidohydrolase
VTLGLVLSCEHGGARVPARWRAALRGASRALASHRGWDEGALPLARRFSRALGVPLVANTWTRLLVDVNRSASNPACFSEWTRSLPAAERERILDLCWRPHRDAVQRALLDAFAGAERVLHISVHSFTPRLAGRTRDVDVGWLYDPARIHERELVERWRRALGERRPDLRLRLNRPYLGTSDGFTQTLRGVHDDGRYLGIELEVNQRLVRGGGPEWRGLQRDLVEVASGLLAAR